MDDVSLVVYIPLELIDFGTGEDIFIDMSTLHQDKKYEMNPAKLLTDRYGELLRYHDVLRAYLPAEQQAGLSILRKFSALPKWELEKLSKNDRPATLTLAVYGSFMPYDRISVRLHLKNGRVIEGFQKSYFTQPMPPQSWDEPYEALTVRRGIDNRQKLYRKLEDCRKNTASGHFSFEIIVPPDVIDDDYGHVEIAHDYDSQVTYDLFQSDEARKAYQDYRGKMLNSVEDNKKTDYDIMKAGFHKVFAEAVLEPVVTMDAEQLRSFGPPIIGRTTLSKKVVGEGSAEEEKPTVVEMCQEIRKDIGAYLENVILIDPPSPSAEKALHEAEITVYYVIRPLYEPLGDPYGNMTPAVRKLYTDVIAARGAGVKFTDDDPVAAAIIAQYDKILEDIMLLAISNGLGDKRIGTRVERTNEETLSSGRLKLEGSLNFHLIDSQPTLRYTDLQKIETMKRHVLGNGIYYSQAVWASLSADERALLFEKYTIEMPASTEVLIDVDGNDNDNTVTSSNRSPDSAGSPNDSQNNAGDTEQDNILIPSMNKTQGTSFPLMNCVINQPLGFYGNCMVLPFVYPPKLAEILGTTSAGLQNALYRYHTQAFRVPTATLSLPTTGMMGDAMLGKNNASEKIDLTRFWNWSDAPIPESDKITSEYFKSGNLLDERVAPASSLPEGAVTTMPITASLLDSVAASNVLQSMVAKQAPSFADLSGYSQLQGMTTSESQARTQLAQQTAQTTQKALETAMQQQNALQQATAVEESLNKALTLAKAWRLEAEKLEKEAANATAQAKAERAKKTVAAPGATLGAEETDANDTLEETAKEHEERAKENRSMALKLRANAADVEKSAITMNMTAMSNIYAPAKATAATADKEKQPAAEGKDTAEGKGK